MSENVSLALLGKDIVDGVSKLSDENLKQKTEDLEWTLNNTFMVDENI